MNVKWGLALAVVLAGLWIVSPMLVPVILGGAFAALMNPVCGWLEKKFKIPRHHASWIALLGATVVLLLPVSLIAASGARAVSDLFFEWKTNSDLGLATPLDQIRESALLSQILEWVNRWINIDARAFADSAIALAKRMGMAAANHVGDGLSHLPRLMVAGSILLFSSYVFLADAKALQAWWRRYSPFSVTQTTQLEGAFVGICRSVLLATVVSGLAQALFFCLGYIFVGGANTAVVGFLIFVFSLVPVLGSLPVTLAVSMYHWFALGQTAVGIALLILAILVSIVDNLVKPWVLKGAGNLHPLLTFVAIFGGVQVLGAAGIFVGPILVAFAIQTLQVVLAD